MRETRGRVEAIVRLLTEQADEPPYVVVLVEHISDFPNVISWLEAHGCPPERVSSGVQQIMTANRALLKVHSLSRLDHGNSLRGLSPAAVWRFDLPLERRPISLENEVIIMREFIIRGQLDGRRVQVIDTWYARNE